jgi:hypothetical protein
MNVAAPLSRDIDVDAESVGLGDGEKRTAAAAMPAGAFGRSGRNLSRGLVDPDISSSGADEGARVGKASGNDSVERRDNFRVTYHRAQSLHRGLRLPVLCVSHIDFLLRNEAGVGFLDVPKPIVGKLLNYEVGLRVLKVRAEFRNLNHRENLTGLDVIAFVDRDRLEISGHLGVQRRFVETDQVAGQIHGQFHVAALGFDRGHVWNVRRCRLATAVAAEDRERDEKVDGGGWNRRRKPESRARYGAGLMVRHFHFCAASSYGHGSRSRQADASRSVAGTGLLLRRACRLHRVEKFPQSRHQE